MQKVLETYVMTFVDSAEEAARLYLNSVYDENLLYNDGVKWWTKLTDLVITQEDSDTWVLRVVEEEK